MIEGGETVVLSASATTSAGASVDTTIACDGGTLLEGVFLLTPEVTSSGTITCTATATSAGRTGTAKVAISVAPTQTGLALLGANEGKVSQGEFALINVENLPFADGSLKATLGGIALPASAMAENVAAIYVPTDAATGTKLLILEAGGKRFSQQVEVVATPLAKSASTIVDEFLVSMDVEVAGWLSSVSLNTTQRTELQALRAEIARQRTGLGSLSAAEMNRTAIQIVANDLHLLGAKSGTACVGNPIVVFRGLALVSAGAATAGVGTLGAATPIGGPLVAVGAGIALAGAYDVLAGLDNFADCLRTEDFFVGPASTGGELKRAAAVTATPLGLDFVNGKARSLQISGTQSLSDELGGDFPTVIAMLEAILPYVPFVEPDVEAKIAYLADTDGTKALDATKASVAIVDGEGLTIQSSATGDVLMVTVSATDPTSRRQEFTFSVTIAGIVKTFSAVVVTQEPIAFDIATEVDEFSTTRIPLAGEGEETFEIVSQPASGQVSIDQATGEAIFTLEQNDGSPITFQYVAVNAYGRSEPATVLVQPIRDFTSDWIVSVRETPSFSNPAGYCEVATHRVDGQVRRLSASEWRFAFQVPTLGISNSVDMSEATIVTPSGQSFVGLYGKRILDVSVDGGTSRLELNIAIKGKRAILIEGPYNFSDGTGTCYGDLSTVSYQRTGP